MEPTNARKACDCGRRMRTRFSQLGRPCSEDKAEEGGKGHKARTRHTGTGIAKLKPSPSVSVGVCLSRASPTTATGKEAKNRAAITGRRARHSGKTKEARDMMHDAHAPKHSAHTRSSMRQTRSAGIRGRLTLSGATGADPARQRGLLSDRRREMASAFEAFEHGKSFEMHPWRIITPEAKKRVLLPDRPPVAEFGKAASNPARIFRRPACLRRPRCSSSAPSGALVQDKLHSNVQEMQAKNEVYGPKQILGGVVRRLPLAMQGLVAALRVKEEPWCWEGGGAAWPCRPFVGSSPIKRLHFIPSNNYARPPRFVRSFPAPRRFGASSAPPSLVPLRSALRHSFSAAAATHFRGTHYDAKRRLFRQLSNVLLPIVGLDRCFGCWFLFEAERVHKKRVCRSYAFMGQGARRSSPWLARILPNLKDPKPQDDSYVQVNVNEGSVETGIDKVAGCCVSEDHVIKGAAEPNLHLGFPFCDKHKFRKEENLPDLEDRRSSGPPRHTQALEKSSRKNYPL
ncbi:hypothetical protein CONPUDRAFT_72090 [Coniophora puteana RWD-64-598 SS2]|uniref:Uncharacterized protein n=1 Tax=Coniophora puteana (strain RWD-64-598) TaxID=741705 RepID=A0A5M3MRG4_CONPW|nr:uncharacterized protein CONPUDRAFT_72090 [Coniophora puteana RWD-64-598 SS2]EIW81667.1 hypothetical protein CONPUDRAFT_72090 [Coniophora puteana RWD-64-598 SS2]